MISNKTKSTFPSDAKYYKYGVTGNTRDLPESTSINKQITYGIHGSNEKKFKKKHGDNMRVV